MPVHVMDWGKGGHTVELFVTISAYTQKYIT
jgi:hypothetical protein